MAAFKENIQNKKLSTTIKNGIFIKEISTKGLFGYYDYTIQEKNGVDLSKLLLIYGDNGSGKTTLLKLAFWLLSPKDNTGFKSEIAKIPFKEFLVKFSNNTEVGAKRSSTTNGSFLYYISENSQVIHKIELVANQEMSIRINEQNKQDVLKYRSVLSHIKSLNVSIFYLTDDRKTLNSGLASLHREDLSSFGTDEIEMIINRNRVVRREHDSKLDPITLSFKKFTDWIQERVRLGAGIGEVKNQTIYAELVKNIVDANITDQSNDISKSDLIKEMQILSARSEDFSKLGLLSNFEYNTIATTLNGIDNHEKFKIVNTVLQPFINGFSEKLKALEDVKNVLITFIENVNSYLYDKYITFTLSDGFNITHNSGTNVSFNNLSSGEKQLLLLFVNTITATSEAAIFIIDEPEISLNIKWQRRLLKTLLFFSKSSNIQFIIATHSLELLTANSENVVRLKNDKQYLITESSANSVSPDINIDNNEGNS